MLEPSKSLVNKSSSHPKSQTCRFSPSDIFGLNLAAPPTITVQRPAKGTRVETYSEIIHLCKNTGYMYAIQKYAIGTKGGLRAMRHFTDFDSQTPGSSPLQTSFGQFAEALKTSPIPQRDLRLGEKIKRFGEGNALGNP